MKAGKYALDYREIVMLGGVPQHIRVRGTDKNNPLLLFLHGGPGVCDRHWVLRNQSALADVCTMVCWDQRGSGKSYSKALSNTGMTVDRMVEDAHELVEYLCGYFHQEKLYIVGHSWGSYLGTLLAQKYPARIAAYVGMGQVANVPENERLSYQYVLDEAKKRNDTKALRELARIGKPQNGAYKTLDDLMVQRNYLSKFGGATYQARESIWTSMVFPLLKTPEYSIVDLLRFARGAFYSLKELWGEVAVSNFMEMVPKLTVPVYITQGRHDQNTPSVLARQWFEALDAPDKEWIWFEASAHSPIKEEPALWGKTIREKLFDADAVNVRKTAS